MGIRRHKPEKIVTEVAAGWRPHSRPKCMYRLLFARMSATTSSAKSLLQQFGY